jgi:hypothetical protein
VLGEFDARCPVPAVGDLTTAIIRAAALAQAFLPGL